MRVQREHLRTWPQRFGGQSRVGSGHGAHVAHRLGEYEVRLQLAERRLIDHIDAARLAHRLAHRRVHFAAVQTRRVEARPRDAGPVEQLGRIVAFVRDRDDPLLEAKSPGDLGAAGEKRSDLHYTHILRR